MKVLLTGAFGNVGKSAAEEIHKKGYDLKMFDIPTKANLKLSKKYKKYGEIFWGDLRDKAAVNEAVENVDVVVHVAAIIPPLADKKPDFAKSINVDGTANIVEAMEKNKRPSKIIYTSSIAVYGDRRKNPFIKVTDALNPNDDDEYAKQKIMAEKIIRDSKLSWTIFRLTYIVSPEKLEMDPLMFKMPLDTKIEICHTKDVGKALANAIENDAIHGKTLNIAGGERCRISYKDYLDRMTEIFGLGKDFLPPEAFATSDFHCGYMDTEESQRLLNYQTLSLEDYFNEVKRKIGIKAPFATLFKHFIRKKLLNQSSYYKS